MDARAGTGGGQGEHGLLNVTLAPRNQRGRSTQEIIASFADKLRISPGLSFG